MKETILIALLGAAGIAAHAQSYVDRAHVQDVQPQYETVQVPREECATQWVTEPRTVAAPAGGSNIGGAVIGGVAGAIVGNQVGKGHGREAATAAGAVIGALAGQRIAASQEVAVAPAPAYEQREVRSCRTVMDQQQRIGAYRVTYEYNGRQYSTVMKEPPGRSIPVRVSVEPEYHRR